MISPSGGPVPTVPLCIRIDHSPENQSADGSLQREWQSGHLTEASLSGSCTSVTALPLTVSRRPAPASRTPASLVLSCLAKE